MVVIFEVVAVKVSIVIYVGTGANTLAITYENMLLQISPNKLPFFIMTSPSKFYCLTQGIMVVWQGQNNANSLKIVSKTV